MPLKVRGRVFTAPESIISVNKLMGHVEREMENLVDRGADEMKQLIETRGTGRRWVGDWGSMPNGTPGRTGSIPGRVASGQMRDDVKSEVNAGTNKVVGVFGWIDNTETYYLMQENRFFHRIGRFEVEGMHALRDAGRLIDQDFKPAMDKAVSAFVRGR